VHDLNQFINYVIEVHQIERPHEEDRSHTVLKRFQCHIRMPHGEKIYILIRVQLNNRKCTLRE